LNLAMSVNESGFTPPSQKRSEETLARMVSAARTALGTKSFDELTLNELTERAGVTVGAFYQRFPSKAAFLRYLEAEAFREIREHAASLFSMPPPDGGRPVGEHIRAFASGLAALYREHGGILRELVQRSRANPSLQQRRMDMTRDVVAGAVDWILAQGGLIGHPEPKKALGVALLFISSALRDVILFNETWVGGDPDHPVDALVEELVQAAEAYLDLPDREGHRTPP
jgi:AcrR family transcriptional regulator